MTFWIQAGDPRATGRRNPEDESIDEAAETVFPLDSEQAYLNWNNIYVPMSYKHDIGTMSQDIVAMLRAMREKRSGCLAIEWPSNTFASRWVLEWESRELVVRSEWRTVVGDTEAMLNARPEVTTSTDEFCAEWRLPLQRLIRGLSRAGYTGEDLPELQELQAEIDGIPRLGILYRTA